MLWVSPLCTYLSSPSYHIECTSCSTGPATPILWDPVLQGTRSSGLMQDSQKDVEEGGAGRTEASQPSTTAPPPEAAVGPPGITTLHAKKAEWSTESDGPTLDFYGRALLPSSRNVQLTTFDDAKKEEQGEDAPEYCTLWVEPIA